MQVTGDWLTNPATQNVLRALCDAGHQALFVGGCVRNALLGEQVGDIDIATDALPDETMRIAVEQGLKAIPTGIDHGTITIISGGIPHEVTTFRKDVSTDGRRAVVAFTQDITKDAVRRDFTVNALYADADGLVVDPLGGLPDIAPRRIRFIQDADLRIKEDYLRILRFFRFNAWYSGEDGIDADGLAACAANLDGLETLSKERVGAEMLKFLSAPDPAPALSSMSICGGLMRVLPGADASALAVLVHLEGDRAPDPIRRLAVIGGEDAADRLRLSKADNKRLAATRTAALDGVDLATVAYQHGAQVALDAALVRAALVSTDLPPGYAAQITKGANAVFPIKAADLPELSGAALGQQLRKLQAEWVASGFELTKSELLR